MAKLWAIIKREYLERVRSKWFLIATFFGPLFFSAIIIVPAWLASRSKATTDIYKTTILDATGNGFGRRLAINIAGDSTDTARMPAVTVVPPSELTRAESTATRTVMEKKKTGKTGYIVVNQQTIAGEAARYAGRNAIYGQTIMSGVLEEKTTRVAEVVMSSVPTDTLLAGKVIGVGAVGLTQQIIWIGTTYVLLKLREPIMAKFGAPTVSFSLPDISLAAGVLFLLFFLLGFIFYSSLYAAVGSSVNSESEARQAATPLLVMIVSTGVFIQPVLLNPTGRTAQVLSLVPISSPIIMPIRMAVTGVPPLELAASLGFLAIGCVAALWLASRIYRVGLLMYGKRPTMKEMARWISYSR